MVYLTLKPFVRTPRICREPGYRYKASNTCNKVPNYRIPNHKLPNLESFKCYKAPTVTMLLIQKKTKFECLKDFKT
jgi:hypothetical protein